MMKKISYIIIFCFVLINNVKADDIRDFELEGFSIGDSLLKSYNKSFIDSRTDHWPGSKKYTMFWDDLEHSETYETIQFVYLSNDTNYLLRAIVAGIIYENTPITKCYEQKKTIINEIKLVAPNAKIEKGKINKHRFDPSGQSTFQNIYLRFNNGDTIAVGCYDWSKKISEEHGYKDHLRISIYDNDHKLWLQNEAFK